jgi:hypothetical protein
MRWTTGRSDSVVYPQIPPKTSLPKWNEEEYEVKTTLSETTDYPILKPMTHEIIMKHNLQVKKEFAIKSESQKKWGVIVNRPGVAHPLLILP